MSNPVGWSSTTPPQYIMNRDPNVSEVARRALMSPQQSLGAMLLRKPGGLLNSDLPAAEAKAQTAVDYGMAVAGMASPISKTPVKAFHTTHEPFDKYDWSRLGRTTSENAGGMSHEQWSLNLAKIGPWASERSLVKDGVGNVSLPVEIGGNAKTFASLDALEKAVRKAGSHASFRESLVEQGFGHISVKDTEFGGRSFIALTPGNFKVTK